MYAWPEAIAVTGISGCVGSSLPQRLRHAGFSGRIVGIDSQGFAAGDPSLEVHVVEASDPTIPSLLGSCGAVIHIADVGRLQAGGPDALASFRATEASIRHEGGPRRLVVVTSAQVYGAHADNALPIGENVVLRPNDEYPPAGVLGELERSVAELQSDVTGLRATTLRPAFVLGPGCDEREFAWLTAGNLIAPRGARPARQFVHADDVAQAIAHVLVSDLVGAFNVAPDGWLQPEEVDGILGRHPPLIRLPQDGYRRVIRRLHGLGLVGLPPSAIAYVQHPWVVANTRLVRSGCTPKYGNGRTLRVATDAARKEDPGRARSLLAVAAAVACAWAAAVYLRRWTGT